METENLRILDFIGRSGVQFYVPIYQRDYDWEESHCTVLFDDIVSVLQKKEKEGQDVTHFMGVIVCKKHDNGSKITVIDGQQRLITIMLLLRAIYERTDDLTLSDKIEENYLTCILSGETETRNKLKASKLDDIFFDGVIRDRDDQYIYNRLREEFFNGIQVNDNIFDNNINHIISYSHIKSNYECLLKRVKKSGLIPSKIFEGIERLEIVSIELNREHENPQIIFESLNSKGLNLEDADLIKNFFFMGLAPDLQDRLYVEYWERMEQILPSKETNVTFFIKDYLIMRSCQVIKIAINGHKVYDAFRDSFPNLSPDEKEHLLEEMLKYAKYYAWFYNSKCPDENINTKLRYLKDLKCNATYPFLLYIFGAFYDVEEQREELCKSLDVIESYAMRKILHNDGSPTYKTFASMPLRIRRNPTPLSNQIAIDLISRTGINAFKSDGEIRSALGVSDLSNNPYIKWILESLECRENGGHDIPIPIACVDFIMPEEFDQRIVGALGNNAREEHQMLIRKIGNLAPLHEVPPYGFTDADFNIKCNTYQESVYRITQEIAEHQQWGRAEIENRTAKMIDGILDVWRYPNVTLAAAPQPNIIYRFSAYIDVTDVNPFKLWIFNVGYDVNSWQDLCMTLCVTLYKHDENTFRDFTKSFDFGTPRGRRYISDNKSTLTGQGERIANDIYVSINLSANDILHLCRLIVEGYNLNNACQYMLSQ